MDKGENDENYSFFWKVSKKELTIVNDNLNDTRLMNSKASTIYIMCCCCCGLQKHSDKRISGSTT